MSSCLIANRNQVNRPTVSNSIYEICSLDKTDRALLVPIFLKPEGWIGSFGNANGILSCLHRINSEQHRRYPNTVPGNEFRTCSYARYISHTVVLGAVRNTTSTNFERVTVFISLLFYWKIITISVSTFKVLLYIEYKDANVKPK